MTDILPRWLQPIQNIMRYIPHILIILSLFFTIVFIMTGQSALLMRTPIIFVPLILTSLFLIRNKNLKCSNTELLANFNEKIGVKIAYICIVLLLITVTTLGYQSPIFLLLTTISYCIIFLQVFSKKQEIVWILGELTIITAILILPQLLSPGLYYGDTDLISHYEWAQVIVNSAHTSPVMETYSTYCLYHILIALSSLTTGVATNTSLYILSTVAVIASIPFIYLLSFYFTKSSKISLIASTLYVLMPMTLHALLIPAPRVMATMAFIIVLYFIFCLYPRHRKQGTVLLLITLTYMALVHHAQLLYIVLVAGLLLIGGIIFYRKETRERIGGILLSFLIPIVSLFVGYGDSVISILKTRLFANIQSSSTPTTEIEREAGNNIVTELLSFLTEGEYISQIALYVLLAAIVCAGCVGVYFLLTHLFKLNIKIQPLMLPLILVVCIFFVLRGTFSSSSQEIASPLLSNDYIPQMIANSSSAVIICFGLMGIYYLLTHTSTIKRYFVLLPLLLIMFVFFVPGVADVFPLLANSLQIYRLRYILIPFFVIAMAVGVAILLNKSESGKRMQRWVAKFTVVVLCLMLITSSIGAKSLSDNDVFESGDVVIPYHWYFTNSDMAMFQKITETFPNSAVVTSDRETLAFLRRSLSLNNGYQLNNNLLSMFNEQNSLERVDFIIFPAEKLDTAGIRLFESTLNNEAISVLISDDDTRLGCFNSNVHSRLKIYDNQNDVIYA